VGKQASCGKRVEATRWHSAHFSQYMHGKTLKRRLVKHMQKHFVVVYLASLIITLTLYIRSSSSLLAGRKGGIIENRSNQAGHDAIVFHVPVLLSAFRLLSRTHVGSNPR
jgi:hypothetical protein